MPEAVLLVRMALAFVFATAAAGKIARPSGARDLLDAFDLDRRLVRMAAAVPWLETAVGAGLVFSATARWAGEASCALLVVFSGLLVRNLRGGRGDAGCNCFGSLAPSSSARASLLRNAVLLAAAALVVASPAQLPASSLVRSPIVAIGVGVLAVVAIGASARVRSPRRSARQATGAARDLFAFEVTTLEGRRTTVGELCGGVARAVLVFVDPECGPCQSLLPTLARRLAGAGSEGLVVVTRGSAGRAPGALAAMATGRVIVDGEGVLALACGAHATPSGVILTRGRVDTLAVGPDAVAQLADPGGEWDSGVGETAAGTSPVRDRLSLLQRDVTRREALASAATAMVAAAVPRLAPLGRLTASLGGRATRTSCPTCGSCFVCQMPGPSTKKLDCRPCTKKCSAALLCSSYANDLPAYRTLGAHLRAIGFVQDGEPIAGGLESGTSLALFGLVTTMRNTSTSTPEALLVYSLTTAGGRASAAILDGSGRITSVMTVTPTGHVVTANVPADPTVRSISGGAGGAGGAAGAKDVPAVATCAQTCMLAWDVILLAIDPILAGELLTPVGWAFAFGSFLVGELGSALAETGVAGKMVNMALNKARGQTTLDKAESYAGQLVCKAVCSLKLTACCNYTGACFGSDAVCESQCPGGLAHPLAHCDVYLNGVKVSTLVPG